MAGCQCPLQTSPFSPMLDDRHISDIAEVNFVNLAAIAVSFADFEQWIRVLLLLASLVYTVMKIIDWIKNRSK
jgi:hypothetical protein